MSDTREKIEESISNLILQVDGDCEDDKIKIMRLVDKYANERCAELLVQQIKKKESVKTAWDATYLFTKE